jgi:cysteine-S-conjugate beta-lyase
MLRVSSFGGGAQFAAPSSKVSTRTRRTLKTTTTTTTQSSSSSSFSKQQQERRRRNKKSSSEISSVLRLSKTEGKSVLKLKRRSFVVMASSKEDVVSSNEEEKELIRKRLSIATKLVHPKTSVEDPYSASAPPLYQTATFAQPNATENGRYDYTRSGNPTRDQLEEQFADIEGATRAFAFSSGMSALATVTRLVKNGERIVTGDDIYGGTSRLLAQVVPEVGIEVVNVDCTDLKAVEEAINGGPTTMVMLESPTNPRLQCIDVRKICEMAKKKGALVCVDNSIMTATFQNPLELGADISMVSATKFIAGHSDVTGGLLAVKGEELAKRVYFFQNACGTLLGPFDCWLALRGIKTMDLRMKRQQENAMKLAEWIDNHPKVQKVNYPGLKSNPFHDVHFSQATGAGSILSFTTGDVNFSKTIVEETKLFKITVSFGGVTSLISLPCFMSHASIPAEVRAARGLPDDLVRISCGIEDAEDLLNDLKRAFEKAEKNKAT